MLFSLSSFSHCSCSRETKIDGKKSSGSRWEKHRRNSVSEKPCYSDDRTHSVPSIYTTDLWNELSKSVGQNTNIHTENTLNCANSNKKTKNIQINQKVWKGTATMRSMGLTICLALVTFQRSFVEGASSMGCQEVRYAYSARGINVYDVPLTPQSGKGHNVLKNILTKTKKKTYSSKFVKAHP